MRLQLLRRAWIIITFAFALVCSLPSPIRAGAIPGPLNELQLRLDMMSTRAPGHIGIMVKDLTTGLSTGVNGSANMPAASTIKIPVMVEVFRQMATGTFDLNRPVTLQRNDRDYGWGDLVFARPGGRYTVAFLLRAMIAESDNTATNMLIRFVGRAHINRTMIELGLHQTRVGDYVRSNGDIRSLRTSPLDMTRLLDAMAHDRLVNAWSSREMIAILTGQHHNGLLPQPLPPGTQIAHKTGTLHDTLNDVGIVYLNDSPYVIAVLTTNLPTLAAGRRFIRGVSRLAYDSLEKFALWREANALPLSVPAPSTLDPQQQLPAPDPLDAAPPAEVPLPAQQQPLPDGSPTPGAVPPSPTSAASG